MPPCALLIHPRRAWQVDDANFAGTTSSHKCTLIVTEGDSAKSLAVSGLSVVGRDYYGVFPLKGKPLNIRDSTHRMIMKNEEIMNLVEIMGLKVGGLVSVHLPSPTVRVMGWASGLAVV